MYPRNLDRNLRAALGDTPVVYLTGARQAGKSTLARSYAEASGATYVTFDDPTVLAATRDATGFLGGLGKKAVIDEVQRAPWLFSAIKLVVDRERRPGRFLLTGSANVLMVPKLSDSLAGRMQILQLWPLSQGEIRHRRERFIDALYEGAIHDLQPATPADQDLEEILSRGGFAEMVARTEAARREAWLASYLRTIVERDVRDLANIEGLVDMPRLAALLAARTGALLNVAELSRSAGIAHTTLKRYLALLQTTFILSPLPAWSGNLGKRLIKSPKIHFPDSALAAWLARYDSERLKEDRSFFGHLLESFVVAELRKQAGWAKHGVTVHYYRSSTGQEVDIVLEDRRGKIAGIEVKATASLGAKDFAGLRELAALAGKRFVGGALLYAGREVVPFGTSLYAMPVSALWRVL